MQLKAYVTHTAGDASAALSLEEVPEPEIADNEVLVEVRAISINPADVKVRADEEGLTKFAGEERSIILGWDVAGVVSRVGKHVSGFVEGDRVFGMVNFPGHGRAFAEYVASPASHLAKIPDGTTFQEAAATTLAALTALQSLDGNVNKGDKVLIHAGSGGVGHFAVQIAMAMGANVTSTSSGRNRDFVLGIGADEHVDYLEQPFEEILADFDFVLDTVGPDVAERSLGVLRPGGRLVTILAMGKLESLQEKAGPHGVSAEAFLVRSSDKDMRRLAEMLADGRLKPAVHKTFSFARMSDAHREVETGRSVGKVIVTV